MQFTKFDYMKVGHKYFCSCGSQKSEWSGKEG